MKQLVAKIFLFSLLFSFPVLAETKTDETNEEKKETPVAAPTFAKNTTDEAVVSSGKNSAPDYLRKKNQTQKSDSGLEHKEEQPLGRVIFALALVALLGGIAVYAKRRRGASPLLKEKVRLHTIGSVQLGPKAQVALLSVGREAILVGVSEQGVSCLRSYKEEELGQLTVGALGPLAHPSPPEDPETAFNDLLVRASKAKPKKSSQLAEEKSPTRLGTSLPVDQFTPTGFMDEAALSPAPNDDVLPPHLKEMLAETESSQVQMQSNVKPIRPASSSQFGEPEGQAAELMRRFAELGR